MHVMAPNTDIMLAVGQYERKMAELAKVPLLFFDDLAFKPQAAFGRRTSSRQTVPSIMWKLGASTAMDPDVECGRVRLASRSVGVSFDLRLCSVENPFLIESSHNAK